jgi:hypothetical protein
MAKVMSLERLVEKEQLGGNVRSNVIAADEGDHRTSGEPLNGLAEIGPGR